MNKPTWTALTFFGASLTSLLVANSAQAAVFNFTYTDTVSFNNNFVDNVNVGDVAVITYQLDNGGTSLFNQTWTASDIVSITHILHQEKLIWEAILEILIWWGLAQVLCLNKRTKIKN